MKATQLKHNVMPGVYEDCKPKRQETFSRSKSLFADHSGNIIKAPENKSRPVLPSLGLIIPFQPSMWDEKAIQTVWNNATHMVQTRLKGKYGAECTNTILTRLQKLFVQLNYNTLRKSLSIMLTPDEEKLIYLSFPVMPFVYCSRTVCLVDLIAKMHPAPDFFYLVFRKESANLFEYNNKQLRKVCETNSEVNAAGLYKKASDIIKILDSKKEKPVFVTGSPNLVEQFCNSEYYAENYFPLLNHIAPFTIEIIQSLIMEITGHWNYWRSKFIGTSVLMAKKANRLIGNTEAVLQTLRNGADGLLLLDRHLKHKLQHSSGTVSAISKTADDLIYQIEKFLVRGNRIEVTDFGMLKDMGGIVLLDNTPSGEYSRRLNYRRNEASSRGELF